MVGRHSSRDCIGDVSCRQGLIDDRYAAHGKPGYVARKVPSRPLRPKMKMAVVLPEIVQKKAAILWRSPAALVQDFPGDCRMQVRATGSSFLIVEMLTNGRRRLCALELARIRLDRREGAVQPRHRLLQTHAHIPLTRVPPAVGSAGMRSMVHVVLACCDICQD